MVINNEANLHEKQTEQYIGVMFDLN
jgi:hypothetical protein